MIDMLFKIYLHCVMHFLLPHNPWINQLISTGLAEIHEMMVNLKSSVQHIETVI